MTRTLEGGHFYGNTRSIRIADAILSEVTHLHPSAIEEHLHVLPFVLLLLEGSYRETSAGRTIVYEPLTLGFHAPGMAHADTIGPNGARMFAVELEQTWQRAIAESGTMPAHLSELHGGEALWLVLRLYGQLGRARDVSALTVESLLYALCACIGKAPEERRPPPWLAPVVATLHARFSERLELRALARDAGVHPSHLARAFHAFKGRPIGDYVTGLRVQEAARRIASGRDALSDIAADVGFADQSHMTRVFKDLTGLPPAAYRREMPLPKLV